MTQPQRDIKTKIYNVYHWKHWRTQSSKSIPAIVIFFTTLYSTKSNNDVITHEHKKKKIFIAFNIVMIYLLTIRDYLNT